MQAKKLKKKYLKKKKNKKIQERKKQQQCVSTVRRVVKSKKGRGRGLTLFGIPCPLIPKYIRSASAKALKT